MANPDHIRNPVEWTADQIWHAALTVGSLGRSLEGSEESREISPPAVSRIEAADLRDVLVRGLDDFGAYRTDVIFLCLIYPLVGIALAWLTFGNETLPLLFLLASGFALVGPVAAVGLYEMSRRREQGNSHHLGRCLRRDQLASLRCDPGAWPGMRATGRGGPAPRQTVVLGAHGAAACDLPALVACGQRDI